MNSPEQPLKPSSSSSDSNYEIPDADIFDYSDVESPITTHYKPAYIAAGGEHVVYEVDGHPDIVVKIPFRPIRLILEYNQRHGVPLNTINETIREEAQEAIERDRRQMQTLNHYFGKEHTVATRKFLAHIPVTQKILDYIFEAENHPTTDTVWVVASAQKKLGALADTDRRSVTSGYSERQDNVDPEEYNRLTHELLHNTDPAETFTLSALLNVQKNDLLNELAATMQEDGGLKEAVRDFVTRAIRYTNETDNFLDLAGGNNVIFYRDKGAWTYKLPDAIYPGESGRERMRQIIALAGEKKTLPRYAAIGLMNAINYARTINGLARYLGIAEQIDLVPDNLKGQAIDYWNALAPVRN